MMMATSNELEKLVRADHDAIIRIESKQDGMAADIKILNSTVTEKLVNLESRVRKIEDVHAQTQPEQQVERIAQLERVTDSLRVSYAKLLTIAALSGAILGTAAGIVARVWKR